MFVLGVGDWSLPEDRYQDLELRFESYLLDDFSVVESCVYHYFVEFNSGPGMTGFMISTAHDIINVLEGFFWVPVGIALQQFVLWEFLYTHILDPKR